MPRSAIAVLEYLSRTGPLPPREISRRAEIPLRTVTFALSRLHTEKILKRVPNLNDMRQPLYLVDSEKARTVFMMYGQKPL